MRAITMAFAALLITLALVVAVGLGLSLRDRNVQVRVDSAAATLDGYARNVEQFFVLSNTFPSTSAELSHYVFGAENAPDGAQFTLVDPSARQFTLSRRIDSTHAFEAKYAILERGVTRLSSALIKVKPQESP